MRIDSGTIGMESARTYSSSEYKVRRYAMASTGSDLFSSLMNTNASDSNEEEMLTTAEQPEEGEDKTSMALSELRAKITSLRTNITSHSTMDEQLSKLREEFIYRLLRLLFPEKYKDISNDMSFGSESTSFSLSDSDLATANLPGSNVMYLRQETMYYYEESESTSFSAQGIVRCKDGREIDFNLNLNMSRSFTECYYEEVEAMKLSLTDPLVINYDGVISDLSDQTFYFDIDSDGVEDEISRLVEGSGFLALDLNEDGIINDGSELFGTKSGNGFKDLAQYDTDHDGFIDEDDEVFEKLKIMTVDEDGTQHLYSLKEKGVGAIALANSATDFSLNSLEDNSTNGIIRRTGVFLYENGNVGTVQQMDLARKNLKYAYA